MRHMSIKRIAAAAAVLIGLAGCALKVPPATQLPNAAGALDPAVDIEANATRHVVWQECSMNCSIVYHRTTSAGAAAKITFSPPAGESYQDPDVAVTDDGKAYIVWRSLTAATNTSTPYFAVIPAGGTVAPARQALGGSASAVIGSDAPRVTARGNTVYAVYFAPSGTNVYIYKRRLNPLDSAATQMNANPNAKVSNASLAIDSAGNLHVAYEYGAADGGQYQAVFYHSPTGGQRLIANTAMAADYYSAPDLELDSADNAYVLYRTGNSFLDVFRARPNGEEQTFAVLRNDTLSWFVNQPDMAVVGSNLEIAFSGTNTGQPAESIAIWQMSFALSNGAVTLPLQVSPSKQWTRTQVKILSVQNIGVIMWTQGIPGVPECIYEAYYWQKSDGVRQAFTSTGCHAYDPELDVAARGEWVSGVALSGAQSNSALPAPWIVYNTK